MVAIVDDIGEVGDPVAEDDHPRLLCQLQIQLDMPMSVDEIVYIGMILDVFFRIEHEMFALLSHKCRLLAVGSFHARMFGPVQSEPHAPARMHGRK